MRYFIALLGASLAVFFSTAASAEMRAPPPNAAPPSLAYRLTDAQRTAMVEAAFNEALIIIHRAGLTTTVQDRSAMFDIITQTLNQVLSRNDMLSVGDVDGSESFAKIVGAAGALSLDIYGTDKVLGAGTVSFSVTEVFGTTISVGENAGLAGGILIALSTGAVAGKILNDYYTSCGDKRAAGEEFYDWAHSEEQKELDDAMTAAKAEADEKAAEREKEKNEGTSTDNSSSGNSENPPADPPKDESDAPSTTSSGTPNPEAEPVGNNIDPLTGKPKEPSKPVAGNGDPNPDVDAPGSGVDPITGQPVPLSQPGGGNDAPAKEKEALVPLLKADIDRIFKHGLPPTILITPEMLARLQNIPGAIR